MRKTDRQSEKDRHFRPEFGENSCCDSNFAEAVPLFYIEFIHQILKIIYVLKDLSMVPKALFKDKDQGQN